MLAINKVRRAEIPQNWAGKTARNGVKKRREGCKTKYLNYKRYFITHIHLRFTTSLAEHFMYFTSHTSAKLDIFNCHTHKGDNTGQMLHLPIPLCLF